MRFVKTTLGQIKTKREALGLSQAEAGARIGMDQRMWSRLERGASSIDLDDLQRIATALEVRVSDLVGETVDATGSEQDVIGRLASLSEEDRQELLFLIHFKQRRAAKQLRVQAQTGPGAAGNGNGKGHRKDVHSHHSPRTILFGETKCRYPLR